MTINTAYGRTFVETHFSANDGAPRKPVIHPHHTKPVAERSYYPGDLLSPAGRAIVQQQVREQAEMAEAGLHYGGTDFKPVARNFPTRRDQTSVVSDKRRR